MTHDAVVLERVRRVMADASEYYGDTILEPMESIVGKAPSSYAHSLCLGRIMMVCAETDEEFASALDAMSGGKPGDAWQEYARGRVTLFKDRGFVPTRFCAVLNTSMRLDAEWRVLMDVCAMSEGTTSHGRFRGEGGCFDNGTFSLGGTLGTYAGECDMMLLFKPTGLQARFSMLRIGDGDWHFMCSGTSENLSEKHMGHVIRLCVESAMASLREAAE